MYFLDGWYVPELEKAFRVQASRKIIKNQLAAHFSWWQVRFWGDELALALGVKNRMKMKLLIDVLKRKKIIASTKCTMP